MEFNLKRCLSGNSNNITCASDIDDQIKNKRIGILIANSYVDFNDYVNPVKRYLDDKYTFRLTPGHKKTVRTYLRHNTAEFRDSLFDLEFSKKEEFYSISEYDVDMSLEIEDGNLFRYIMRLDHNKDHYERSVYTIIDLTGQIGGLYEIFQLVGKFLIGFISSKILILTMMSKMYHVQTHQNDEDEDNWKFDGVNKIDDTKSKRIEPKLQQNRFSHLSKRLEQDESKSEINSNLSINKSASEDIQMDEFRKGPQPMLDKFYELNAEKNSSKNENQDSKDLIDQLQNSMESRRRYHFN